MKKYLFLIFLILLLSLTSIRVKTNYYPPLTGNEWETISPATLGWCDFEIENLYSFLDETNSKAFIVLKNGKIVLEKYFDTFTRDSVWYWASAGKALTATTVGIARQEGLLSLQDKSSQYLGQGWTSAPKEQEDKITLWHQLTMTSGLNDAAQDPHCTDKECLEYLADAGTRWAYHNAPYTLLDGVIADATGLSLNQYFAAKIRNKIGMGGLFYKAGFNNVYFSNARSMARFGLFMLNNGNWDGEQIVSDQEYFNDMVNSSQDLNKSYGYLWWLNGKESFMIPQLQTVFPGALNPNAPDDMFAAMGKNGQFINVVPSMNLVIIPMGETPGQSLDVEVLYNDEIWEHFNKIICEPNAVNPEKEPQVEIYPNPGNGKIHVQFTGSEFNLELRNFNGQLVSSLKNCTENAEINTDQLSAGIYFVKVNNGKGKQVLRKLVLQ